MTNDDATDFLDCSGDVIEFSSPEKAQEIMRKIQEANKYREWWEKLKGELLEEPKADEDSLFVRLVSAAMLRRMIQIENEAHK